MRDVDGVTVNLDPNVRYYALHKPPGVVTTMHDPQGRPDIRGFLPDEGPACSPSGASTGTAKASCCSRTTASWRTASSHPRYGVEKEYLAEVEGAPDRPADRPDPAGGRARRRARASPHPLAWWPRADREARVRLDDDGGPQARGPAAARGGRAPVTRLVRLRIGPVELGSLAPGALRELDARGGPRLSRAPPTCSLVASGATARRGEDTS